MTDMLRIAEEAAEADLREQVGGGDADAGGRGMQPGFGSGDVVQILQMLFDHFANFGHHRCVHLRVEQERIPLIDAADALRSLGWPIAANNDKETQ